MNEIIGQEKAWEWLMKDRKEKIRQNNVRTYAPDELQSSDLNFGVILRIPEGINGELHRRLLDSIPSQYHAKTLFQDPLWYHMTIQWAPEKEVGESVRLNIFEKIKKIVETTNKITGQIRFPYFADGGFMAGFFSENDGEVASLKRQVQKVWNDNGIKLYLPEIYDETAYISLSRFLEKFDESEIPKMENLSLQSIDVTFDTAVIVLNDKIMSPDRTKVLAEYKFR
jgi:hypothetical protein